MQISYCHWQKREGAYFHSSLLVCYSGFLLLEKNRIVFVATTVVHLLAPESLTEQQQEKIISK